MWTRLYDILWCVEGPVWRNMLNMPRAAIGPCWRTGPLKPK